MGTNTTWVVVASNAQAKIFRMVRFPEMEELAGFVHPESRLHNLDLVSSQEGRTFDRGGTTRHSYEKTEPREVEAEKFAKHLSNYLASARGKGEFSRLYIVASPTFLGLLRQHMDPHTRQTIIGEVGKDMVKHKRAEIEQQLAAL